MSLETKDYFARLRPLGEEQERSLEHWAKNNCWRSALMRHDTHTNWAAVREKRRSQPAWARHVKEILHLLGIQRCESRNWLMLCSVEEAEEFMDRNRLQQQKRRGGDAEEEDKLIELSGSAKGSSTKPSAKPCRLQVTKG